MANKTTGAQRYNARMGKIWDQYYAIERIKERMLTFKDILPTCLDYKQLLAFATLPEFGLTIEQARAKYGQFTYGQWKALLGF